MTYISDLEAAVQHLGERLYQASITRNTAAVDIYREQLLRAERRLLNERIRQGEM
jgi:hypothetical protein